MLPFVPGRNRTSTSPLARSAASKASSKSSSSKASRGIGPFNPGGRDRSSGSVNCAASSSSLPPPTTHAAEKARLVDYDSFTVAKLRELCRGHGIDSSTFAEKSEFTAALQNARSTMPRPSTTYREVEQPKPEREEKKSSFSKKPSSSSSQRSSGNSSSSSRRPAPPTPAPAAATASTNHVNIKKLTAMRSPVTAFQQIKEHPSQNIIGERNSSFLPGSPFSFSLHGSVQESDSAIIRIPDGVCLEINCASVSRKEMDEYLKQKGSIGVSLRLSSEENPEMLPIWTFARDRSSGYTMSGLGLRVCGPRTVRLLAFMEMGYRSGQSVDVHVFGSVSLNKDAFD